MEKTSTSDDIDEVIVTEGGACLRHEFGDGDNWWCIHAESDEFDVPCFDSAADLRRFLTASLAALDEWEARRG